MCSDERQTAEVIWHIAEGQAEDRSQLLGQRPTTVWLTGLSASGKFALAFALERNRLAVGSACYVLDGDKYQAQIE